MPVTRFLLLLSAFFHAASAFSQAGQPAKPRLVVAIVVDQMRNDFIYRYWDRFGAEGFKRLANQGFYFRNAHYNYTPTYTGPGHASIFTGTTPRAHGIIANNWFVKHDGSTAYCAYDPAVKAVGSDSEEGKMSPVHLLSSTIGDELKMSSNGTSKVFAIALKDRSAVLPAGHAADGAFWFEPASARFITSTYYMQQLPGWLNDFNARGLPREYLAKGWQTLYPVASYTSSVADDNRYEGLAPGKDKPVFPYDFSTQLEKNELGYVKNTPWANTLTKELALACLKWEQLGKDTHTDLLCISFSAPDIIGHAFGPRAVEIEDVYLRLDRDIQAILEALDKEVGRNNYTLFLTADHGAVDVPNHLSDQKIPAGFLYESGVRKQLRTFLQQNYGDSLLLRNVSNDQVFLDEGRMAAAKLERHTLEQKICEFLVTINGVAEAYPSAVLKNGAFAQNDYRSLLQNGYNHRLSGNVAFFARPNYIDHSKTGTTHGAGYNYDTHVPLIFYGHGVSRGESLKYTTITQIAPTICEMMRISQPNACTSEPLNDLIR